ncbi:bromodomain containing protein [Nitzschia inconspicua]|uniref:Bromodomain containing protein n=1 Tax=Nitzschia inconspicua TaxID=303405 RepID=A0A9K3KLG4_9STRA|nr:bromodomain containing protein [Nitzschia inconspicua]
MTPQEKEQCRSVIKTLRSEKMKKYTEPFMYPFDVSAVPGYLDVNSKVIDIYTLSENLEADVYPDVEAFFKDCKMIFQNAINYHIDKDMTKWLVKPAKSALKVVEKERQKIEKKLSGAAGDKPNTADSTAVLPAPKPKIKISVGGGANGGFATGTAKLKIKTKVDSEISPGKTPPPGVDMGASHQPQPKKPRLILKMGSVASSLGGSGTPKSTTSASSKSKSGGGSGSGVSRGKELPKGVTAPEPKVKGEPKPATKKSDTKSAPNKKATTKKASIKITTGKQTPGNVASEKTAAGKAPTAKKEKPPSKTKITVKTATKSSSKEKVPFGIGTSIVMTPARRAQCSKVLNGLRRRQAKNIIWFDKPVSDKNIISDYRAKIKHPMDLSTMQSKLDNGGYSNVASFALDLRRIFSNCLQYNTSIVKDSLRPIAVEAFETADQLLMYFLAKPEYPQPTYAPLLFCWKLCLSLLDSLYNLINPDDKLPTAFFFMFPVAYYFGGQLPSDYPPKPMDFGTITAKLMEGYYSGVEEFETDCKLVIENCMKFNGQNPESKRYCEQAQRLYEVMQQQLDNLKRYIKSSAGQNAEKAFKLAVSLCTLPKPAIPVLLSVLAELRELKYTDKFTKITEDAMANFEKPISAAVAHDYMSVISTPMDLQTVERKIKSSQYATPEDFEFDMTLMFQNCITYNTQRKIDHLVALGKFGLKNFRRIFSAKMKLVDDPSSAHLLKPPIVELGVRKDVPEGGDEQGHSKKQKIELIGSGISKPKVTLNAATISEAQKAAAQSQGRKSPKLSISAPKEKSDQPVPLHIAIAKVKLQFPLRRNIKNLQPWELACSKFFKELMRHPWISAARPKFIFHVPVPILFPALKEAYAAKISKPMDLTTVECTLMAGNRYSAPEDFVADVALVFTNSITFNKEGRDVGDPLSCAYYEASIHLLKYARWLSLESLSEYLQDSDHVDEPEADGLPVSSWKLTRGNKQRARKEMEDIVLKEPIEKSLEGDKFTWTESECERLLKSLRLQSDYRYMSFFLTSNYPADYAAFISRPMDWEKVSKNLKKRQYDTIGQVMDDLRLIFKNALKYNQRLAGTDTISGQAYEAAKIMSAKLEVAINKCMLTVSDRVERERIDHSNAEREIEAAERAEEAKIREQWKREGKDPATIGPGSLTVEGSQRIRTAKRIVLRRSSETDFEVPFFDEEDDGQHERSYFEVMKQQKATFERQRAELVRMRFSTGKIGQSIFCRSMQHQLALQWIAAEQKRLGISSAPKHNNREGSTTSRGMPSVDCAYAPVASSVLAKLDSKDRVPLKISLNKGPKKKASKSKVVVATMDWSTDDE